MEILFALLIGIPCMIAGFQSTNRRQADRHAPAEAAQRYIDRDEARRQAPPAPKGPRFRDTEDDGFMLVNPETGEVRDR